MKLLDLNFIMILAVRVSECDEYVRKQTYFHGYDSSRDFLLDAVPCSHLTELLGRQNVMYFFQILEYTSSG